MGPLRRQARGVSLVELLVSTAVGTVAIAAALVLMQQGRRAQLEADAVARLADIAASAADVLAAEVRVAGYLGRLPPGSAVIGATPFGLPAPEGLSDAVESDCREAEDQGYAQVEPIHHFLFSKARLVSVSDSCQFQAMHHN